MIVVYKSEADSINYTVINPSDTIVNLLEVVATNPE